ncbi:MAG: BatA domain-containing protein [Gemmatimonadota bacterium]
MPLWLLVPAFLAGLAAIVIPIVIHLRRRPRSKVVPFPSLMFLEKVPIKSEQKRRIHNWFLLSLRALALALLAFAFARPFFTDASSLAATGSGPTERVILLDRSWSMAAGDRWERGVEAAREAVASLGPLDRASLVVFDQGAETVVRGAPDAQPVRAALDTLATGARATAMGPGLKLVETILQDSDLAAGEVVIVSDFQANGWTGDEGVAFPDGTTVRTVELGGDEVDNRAVTQVALNRERVESRDRISPAARIVRTGGNAEAEVEVRLELDGRVVQTRPVTLPAEGAAGVAFDPVTVARRHTLLTVALAADDLPQDDTWNVVLSPGRATQVHLLSRGSRGTAGPLYLRNALEISEEQAFQVTASDGVPGPGTLSERHVVLLNDRSFPGGAEGARLAEWVRAGGGLILVAGERGGWPADATDLFPGTLGGVVDREDARGERLVGLDYDHPVFEVFRGARQGDFASARFYRARSFQVEEGDSVRVLARFDDGSAALAERRVGEGRVLVWSSTLDAFWTDLALKPVFLPFVHQLVRYASGRNPAVEAFTTGQVLDVTDAGAMESAGLGEVAEALASSEERVALTPTGETVDLDEGRHFLSLDHAGFYQIRPPGQDGIRPVAIAVNVDRREAELAVRDAREIVAAVGGAVDGTPTGSAAQGPEAERLRQEDLERRQSLWRYLLLGALALLLLETLLSNRLGRGTGTGGGHARATG